MRLSFSNIVYGGYYLHLLQIVAIFAIKITKTHRTFWKSMSSFRFDISQTINIIPIYHAQKCDERASAPARTRRETSVIFLAIDDEIYIPMDSYIFIYMWAINEERHKRARKSHCVRDAK